MSKVILKSSDNIYEYDVCVFVSEDNKEISYVEDDSNKTFVSFDYKNNILKRDNNKMYMEFDFNHEKGHIIEKSLNKKIYTDIKVKSIDITSKNIVIEYYNNGDFYQYKIKI